MSIWGFSEFDWATQLTNQSNNDFKDLENFTSDFKRSHPDKKFEVYKKSTSEFAKDDIFSKFFVENIIS